MPQESAAADDSGSSSLTIELDLESMRAIASAAELQQLSVSDYVRKAAITHARLESATTQSRTLALPANEQIAFWTALAAPAKLTPRQKKLGKLMRGKR